MSAKRENPKRTYRALLQRSPAKFLEALSDNIMQGPPRRHLVLLQLDLLAAHDMNDELEQFRVNGDESLLQLAAIFHGDVEVMSRLASACPRLLLLQRQGEYEGQTLLHTLVSKQNVAAVSALLQHPGLREPWVLLNGKVSWLSPSSPLVPLSAGISSPSLLLFLLLPFVFLVMDVRLRELTDLPLFLLCLLESETVSCSAGFTRKRNTPFYIFEKHHYIFFSLKSSGSFPFGELSLGEGAGLIVHG